MNVEKIEGPSGPKPTDRKGRKSTPDSKEFHEMMKTEKVRETEFEGKRKKKYKKSLEEEKKETSRKKETTQKGAPSPYETQPKSRPPPPESHRQTFQSQESKEPRVHKQNAEPSKQKDEPKETQEHKKTEDKKESTDAIFHEKELSKEGKITPPSKEKDDEKKIKGKKETSLPVKEEEKKKKTIEDIKKEAQLSQTLKEFPPHIAAQAIELTTTTSSYLHPDIVPIFEKMVGTIIQMTEQGVSKTEVILNSAAFTTSVFYGSSIVLEKYSTALNAFNITLKGPTQAVNIFNENLEGLMDAFKKGNFSFTINRLETEYERPLFKRKEKTGEKKEGDSGPLK